MRKKVLLLGGLLVDRYLHLMYYPERGEDTLINDEKEYIGGCPYNVAIALKSLGVEPIVYSAIGNGPLGQFIEDEIRNKNLDDSCLFKSEKGESGYCLIMLDNDKERTFFAKHGCEGQFNPEIISSSLFEEIEYIYLTGIYALYKDNNQELIKFLTKAKEHRKKIVFDVAPMIGSIPEEVTKQILPLCHSLKVNKNERLTLEKIIDSELSKSSLLSNVHCIVETNGAQGSIVHYKNQSLHIPSYPTNIIDSNGAGDNFTAGFIYCLLQNLELEETAKFANACGSLACETLGTTVTYTENDVKNKMKNS